MQGSVATLRAALVFPNGVPLALLPLPRVATLPARMSHTKSIIIKCPACSAKFDAEREEESTFVSCPECDMQVKISGTGERGRSPRRMAPAPSIPSRREPSLSEFGDISGGGLDLDLEGARQRAQERLVNEELVIDDDEPPEARHALPKEEGEGDESSKKSLAGLTSIERRAAKLEQRAARLEERAAKLAKLREKRDKAREALASAEAKAATRSEEAKTGPIEEEAELPKKAAEEPAPKEEVPAMEKVEVRTHGERLRLRKAPKAKVPEPRGRPGAPRYVSDLSEQHFEEVAPDKEVIAPKQDFEERQVSEGAEWRRHQPSRIEDPDWEQEEEEEKSEVPEYERKHRMFVWTLVGLAGLFALVASYQFILAQIGWLKPMEEVSDAPPIPENLQEDLSKSEMLQLARPVIEKFFASQSNEEALQYVRRAGKVAFFMKKHYAPGTFEPIIHRSLGDPETCSVVDDRFFVVPVTLPDYSQRGIALEIPDGIVTKEWLVDWESWVGYSEMGFSELQIRRPTEPVILRCFMIQDEYYNYHFSDNETYVSFKLLNYNQDSQIWGYLDKSSTAFREVRAVLTGSLEVTSGEELATLKVRYPETVENDSGAADQVEIVELVTFGWVVSD